MKESIAVLLLSLMGNIAIAQQKSDAEKLVDEGIALHDKGDYQGAISKYDKVLELDSDNLLALAEKAMSLLALRQYEGSIEICQQAIKKHPGKRGLAVV